MIPIVIYNGKPRWGWPRKLSELLEPLPQGYEEYQPECSFLLIDEGRFQDEDLAAQIQNFVALLFRLENSQQGEELGDKIRILNEELEKSQTPELEEVFDIWLDRVIQLRFPSINFGELRGREKRTMLSESIAEWIGEVETDKTRRIRQEACQEGIKDVILGQLEERFGVLPTALASKIRSLKAQDRLQKLARQTVVISSLDELELA